MGVNAFPQRMTKRKNGRQLLQWLVPCQDCDKRRWIQPWQYRNGRQRRCKRCAILETRRAKGYEGRHKDKKGYITIGRLAIPKEDWPLFDKMQAQRTHAGLLEHRWVMARELGRPLERSETVHHINGIKDDNRIENLELRNGKHGTGNTMPHCMTCTCREEAD